MRIKAAYRRIRSRRWSALILDLGLFAAVFWAITAWQTRHLLPGDQLAQAPGFTLPALDGQTYTLEQALGKPVLLYFFAPWCSVCNLSAHNLRDLRDARSDDELAIYLIASGYGDSTSVRAFAEKHRLTMPILLDNGRVAADYRVEATPTYYVIDAQGRVQDRSVGYSTEWGLRWRTL
ncbi:Thiol-disulfide oxidoreductase ResA [subsurface metagenome]